MSIMPSIFAAFLLLAGGVAARQAPSILKALPFTRIADEIAGAEQNAREMSWQVSNSTAEKASLQWFMASAMKELTGLTKDVMNASSEGSLGYHMSACINRTEAQQPLYNQTLGLKRSIQMDSSLAPKMLEAEMYQLYYSERRSQEITKDIGLCRAKCPVSFLAARTFKLNNRAKVQAKARGSSIEHTARQPNPQQMMRSIADAIYNTSQSIDIMREQLSKDGAAKQVLQSLSATVMSKLLAAHREIEEMTVALEVCQHTPEKTDVLDQSKEIMKLNPEVSYDLVKTAQERTKGARQQYEDLKEKLQACRKKCDVWYQYKDE